MRNSLLAIILIAFGTTVAMPANACCVQQKDADEGVTTGIAGTAGAPSDTSQHPQMNAGKNVTRGSTAGTTKAVPSETLGEKYRSMTDSTVGTGPG